MSGSLRRTIGSRQDTERSLAFLLAFGAAMQGTPKPLRPRKSPRQKRSSDTRERIVQAAARVFVEHGYAAGTTNRIAEEAGLSIGSLYQYFPNKDALLLELTHRHIEEGRQVVVAALERGLPSDCNDRVALFVDTALEAHRGDSRLHQVLFEESPRPPALLAELHTLQNALVDTIAELLSAAPDVDFSDARLGAWFLVSTTESLTHRYFADRPTSDITVFREELITLLTAYLRHERTNEPTAGGS
ncbi:TetR/AcrR family transcriptional regulator [Actinomadura algeriensis]|uniref:AcrR family transcriptional regulator n=1 Tax=Actinomadura algeriensis TaxID=1679523 RepID=A0ABR9JZ44_9ACTN|nr:TetR/AcrR family transcriptional regulator [Actinomadura algeriensis]MBE1535838.1 AcrR family transcriptional regulator [Actinomadura algeriensis]